MRLKSELLGGAAAKAPLPSVRALNQALRDARRGRTSMIVDGAVWRYTVTGDGLVMTAAPPPKGARIVIKAASVGKPEDIFRADTKGARIAASAAFWPAGIRNAHTATVAEAQSRYDAERAFRVIQEAFAVSPARRDPVRITQEQYDRLMAVAEPHPAGIRTTPFPADGVAVVVGNPPDAPKTFRRANGSVGVIDPWRDLHWPV